MPKSTAYHIDLGTDGASTPPTGTGIRGWLRNIYEALVGLAAAITGSKTLQDLYTRLGDGSQTIKVRNSAGTVIDPATSTDLTTRLGTLGRKASAASAPVVLSDEQEAYLRAIPSGTELLSNANLMEDLNADSVPDGWTGAGTSPAFSQSERSWSITSSAANQDVFEQLIQAGAGIYHFAFRAKRVSGTGTMQARMQFLDSAQVAISTAAAPAVTALDFFTHAVQFAAPAGTAYIKASMRASASGARWSFRRANLLRWDGPVYEQFPAALDAGSLMVQPQGLPIAEFGQLDVGTTEVAIPVTADSKSVAVKGLKANGALVYVAKTGVLATNGWELDAGEGVVIDVSDGVPLFAIAASGTQRICYAKVA